MKRFVDMKENIEETNYWIPVSNILAAFMLVLLVVLVAGFSYLNNLPKTAPQQEQEPAENVDESYLAELEAKEARLDAQNAVLKELSGIRDGIIAELAEKFESQNINAVIDKTGRVSFNNAVLFDDDKNNLKLEGEKYLKKLVPAYLSVVLSEKNREFIDQIVIEGHASDDGNYLYNLSLSQSRAYNVVGYLISSGLTTLNDNTDAQKKLTISGKSFSRPVLIDGTVDKRLSRRVELVFMLKYDRMMDQMQDAVKGGEE